MAKQRVVSDERMPDERTPSAEDIRQEGFEELQGATAGLDGVLGFLEPHGARSEACYSAYCIVDALKDRFRSGLRKAMLTG